MAEPVWPEWNNIDPQEICFCLRLCRFAGFEITADSVRPCKMFVQAIFDLPTPKNITDIRSLLGLVNHVAYAYSVTDRMVPFRQLLKPITPFNWTTELQALFDEY